MRRKRGARVRQEDAPRTRRRCDDPCQGLARSRPSRTAVPRMSRTKRSRERARGTQRSPHRRRRRARRRRARSSARDSAARACAPRARRRSRALRAPRPPRLPPRLLRDRAAGGAQRAPRRRRRRSGRPTRTARARAASSARPSLGAPRTRKQAPRTCGAHPAEPARRREIREGSRERRERGRGRARARAPFGLFLGRAAHPGGPTRCDPVGERDERAAFGEPLPVARRAGEARADVKRRWLRVRRRRRASAAATARRRARDRACAVLLDAFARPCDRLAQRLQRRELGRERE